MYKNIGERFNSDRSNPKWNINEQEHNKKPGEVKHIPVSAYLEEKEREEDK